MSNSHAPNSPCEPRRRCRSGSVLQLLTPLEAEALPASPTAVAALLGAYSDSESACRSALSRQRLEPPTARAARARHLTERPARRRAACCPGPHAPRAERSRRYAPEAKRRRRDPAKGVHALREFLRGPLQLRRRFSRRVAPGS